MFRRRNGAAAKPFFKRLLSSYACSPLIIVTDKLAGYKVAPQKLMPIFHHGTTKYVNNRAERSH